MKHVKKLLALLLMVAMLLPLLPAIPVHASEIVDSGYCGVNLEYTLDDNGLLTISGRGQMNDWTYQKTSPFFGKTDIKALVIESGVTSVGDYAFYGCTSLTNVVLSKDVLSIGSSAFDGCKSLQKLTLPKSVTKIEYDAFEGCTNLSDVFIDDLTTWCSVQFDSIYSIILPIPIHCTKVPRKSAEYPCSLNSGRSGSGYSVKAATRFTSL